MEATFISVMFFGWERVSRRFHLAATWLTTAGATLSALWILVANAWMQHPAGMVFNPDTARCEMTDFWAVLTAFSLTKFAHTVASSWLAGAAFVVTVAAWYLLKRRETRFALDSVRVAAAVGAAGLLLTLHSGDKSAYQVAALQPMKFAAMEGLYDGGKGVGLVGAAILKQDKQFDDGSDPYLFNIAFPGMLSFLATRDFDGYVPGIADIVRGGYTTAEGETALSAAEKISRGRAASEALKTYKTAADAEQKAIARAEFEKNKRYFGYSFFKSGEDLIPPVGLVFYSFRIMVCLGFAFLLLFIVAAYYVYKDRFATITWLQRICLWSIPFAYIASQAGWIVAEVGRQPWAIQDVLPVQAAVTNIGTASVVLTFFIFLALFTTLLIAELRILLKAIKQGPEEIKDDTHY